MLLTTNQELVVTVMPLITNKDKQLLPTNLADHLQELLLAVINHKATTIKAEYQDSLPIKVDIQIVAIKEEIYKVVGQV